LRQNTVFELCLVLDHINGLPDKLHIDMTCAIKVVHSHLYSRHFAARLNTTRLHSLLIQGSRSARIGRTFPIAKLIGTCLKMWSWVDKLDQAKGQRKQRISTFLLRNRLVKSTDAAFNMLSSSSIASCDVCTNLNTALASTYTIIQLTFASRSYLSCRSLRHATVGIEYSRAVGAGRLSCGIYRAQYRLVTPTCNEICSD
jgi:hypothetical protein